MGQGLFLINLRVKTKSQVGRQREFCSVAASCTRSLNQRTSPDTYYWLIFDVIFHWLKSCRGSYPCTHKRWWGSEVLARINQKKKKLWWSQGETHFHTWIKEERCPKKSDFTEHSHAQPQSEPLSATVVPTTASCLPRSPCYPLTLNIYQCQRFYS